MPAGDPAQFNFTITGGPDSINVPVNGLTDASAPTGTGQVKPGTYTVAEAAAAGWTNTALTCKDQGNVNVPVSNGQITVGPGQTVTCKFVNVKKGQLTLNKQFVGGPSSQRANLFIKQGGTVINGGAGQKLDAANGEGTGAQVVSAGHVRSLRDRRLQHEPRELQLDVGLHEERRLVHLVDARYRGLRRSRGRRKRRLHVPQHVQQLQSDGDDAGVGGRRCSVPVVRDLSDTATLAGGFAPTGTITFQLYSQ